ncbi:MAG: L-ribulose-5-phosphate 4-epimerase [Anaerolineaceae bacterium]|nr:L-ribulose-5-phosphate 4-epimerase [Anaerolineaceae bacterium]
MLESLKQEVCEANMSLAAHGLVLFTWGNMSAFDPQSKLVVIKPSGVSYENMKPDDMVVVNLDGEIVDGKYQPSSDTLTHLEIYKNFDGVGAVVHTHSKWATIWSQARRSIPALGTTHADNFYGEIPVTRLMTPEEIQGEYELETGKVIVEIFMTRGIDPLMIQSVLVANHGPFSWGKNAGKAVENAVVLEYVAEMAYYSLNLNQEAGFQQAPLDKHYLRKHGKDAYYGQNQEG